MKRELTNVVKTPIATLIRIRVIRAILVIDSDYAAEVVLRYFSLFPVGSLIQLQPGPFSSLLISLVVAVKVLFSPESAFIHKFC